MALAFFMVGSMKLSIKTHIKSMLILGAFVPFFVPFFTQAQVNVTLHKDVEALVVNGESLPMTIMEKKRFSLPGGKNQLVVRLSKLVESGSQFEKFKSDPLVITFDASDVNFTVSPTRAINSERQIKDFRGNPSFRLLTANDKDVSATQDVLPAGPGLLRDYEKELVKFNQKRGVVLFSASAQNTIPAASVASPVISVPSPKISQEMMAIPLVTNNSINTLTSVRHAPAQSQTEALSENAQILMKADFLRMTPKDKQTFLRWAVKNVNF